MNFLFKVGDKVCLNPAKVEAIRHLYVSIPSDIGTIKEISQFGFFASVDYDDGTWTFDVEDLVPVATVSKHDVEKLHREILDDLGFDSLEELASAYRTLLRVKCLW